MPHRERAVAQSQGARINLVSEPDMDDNHMERMEVELANLTSRQQAMFQQMQEMMVTMNTRLDHMTRN